MKRAKVTSVYEGKDTNRSIKGEEARKNRSKHARMTAKARMNVHKESMKPLPKHNKPMMIMKAMRKNDDEEAKNNQNIVLSRIVEKENKVEAKSAVENIEVKMESPFRGWVEEEWPHTLTYEEEWTWLAFAFGWEWWLRYDAVMNGGA
ncbi:unnamed protein product [Cochlearia groenlandica]